MHLTFKMHMKCYKGKIDAYWYNIVFLNVHLNECSAIETFLFPLDGALIHILFNVGHLGRHVVLGYITSTPVISYRPLDRYKLLHVDNFITHAYEPVLVVGEKFTVVIELMLRKSQTGTDVTL